jgi:hypothetical protein
MEWNGTFLSAAGQSLLSLCRGGKIADCGLPGLFNSSLSGKESVFRCERFERFVPDFFLKNALYYSTSQHHVQIRLRQHQLRKDEITRVGESHPSLDGFASAFADCETIKHGVIKAHSKLIR